MKHMFAVYEDDSTQLHCEDEQCVLEVYFVKAGECAFEAEDDSIIYEKLYEAVPGILQLDDEYHLNPGQYEIDLEWDGDVDDEGRGIAILILDYKGYSEWEKKDTE